MKKYIFLILLLPLFAIVSSAQTKNYDLYKKRAEVNLKYLSNDFTIKSRVRIDPKGITVFKDHSKTTHDLDLYWNDLPKFVEIIENWNYYEMVRAFMSKGSQAFQGHNVSQHYHWYNPLPDTTEIENISIAIDPGHFAGNSIEAEYEKRYAKFRGKEVGKSNDILFYEADLTYAIAVILEQEIKKKYPGILVKITRPYGKSALGKTFKEWMRDDFRNDLEVARKAGDVNTEMYKLLSRDSAVNERFVFEKFFKLVEFRKRIQIVNEFKPTMTFVIHLNAQEGNKRSADGYLSPVDENYHMVFVPGAFLNNELERVDHKVDFFRLLTSQDLQNSMRMGDLVMKHTSRLTGVPVISRENDLKVLRDVSIPTDYEGVYCRNLGILRMIRGVITYGEFLVQDNKEELHKLAAKDYSYKLSDGKVVKTSKRAYEIAMGHVLAVEEYLSQNIEMKKMQKQEIESSLEEKSGKN